MHFLFTPKHFLFIPPKQHKDTSLKINQENKEIPNERMNPMNKKKSKVVPHHTRVSFVLLVR
jgi:hypothetical protein